MESLTFSDVERRQYSRKILIASAELLLDVNTCVAGRTLDISEGGLSVVANANLRIGAELKIRTQVPVKELLPIPFLATVTVAYCGYSGVERGFMIGMKFSEISNASKHLIERYVYS